MGIKETLKSVASDAAYLLVGTFLLSLVLLFVYTLGAGVFVWNNSEPTTVLEPLWTGIIFTLLFIWISFSLVLFGMLLRDFGEHVVAHLYE